MRVKLMKQLGVAYLEIDDELCIKFTFSDDYPLGELGRVCQIFKNLYYDDTSKDYFRKRT
jgi:hypothetical protein